MKNIFSFFAGMIDALSRLGGHLAKIALVLLLILVFHEVVARYLFDAPTLYSVEVSEYLLVFVAFMAGARVLQDDNHVRMLTFVSLLPPALKKTLDIITSLIVLLFCVVLVWQGGKSSIIAFQGDYHSSSLLNTPMWLPYSIIPAGSLLLALQYAVRIGRLLTSSAPGRHRNS